MEELLLNQSNRTHSLQVVSQTAFILFMSTKQFKDQVLNNMPYIRHAMCEMLKNQQQLHGELETNFLNFRESNLKPTESEEKQEIEFTQQLSKVKQSLDLKLPAKIKVEVNELKAQHIASLEEELD